MSKKKPKILLKKQLLETVQKVKICNKIFFSMCAEYAIENLHFSETENVLKMQESYSDCALVQLLATTYIYLWYESYWFHIFHL